MRFTGGCWGVPTTFPHFAGLVCRSGGAVGGGAVGQQAPVIAGRFLAFYIDFGQIFSDVLVQTIRFFVVLFALIRAIRLFLTGG